MGSPSGRPGGWAKVGLPMPGSAQQTHLPRYIAEVNPTLKKGEFATAVPRTAMHDLGITKTSSFQCCSGRSPSLPVEVGPGKCR